MTRTFVLLEVSSASFKDIRAKIKEAGYDHAINCEDGRETIDMYGIALIEEASTSQTTK